jgi:hypothetical protein
VGENGCVPSVTSDVFWALGSALWYYQDVVHEALLGYGAFQLATVRLWSSWPASCLPILNCHLLQVYYAIFCPLVTHSYCVLPGPNVHVHLVSSVLEKLDFYPEYCTSILNAAEERKVQYVHLPTKTYRLAFSLYHISLNSTHLWAMSCLCPAYVLSH